jgi:hypothetical protein
MGATPTAAGEAAAGTTPFLAGGAVSNSLAVDAADKIPEEVEALWRDYHQATANLREHPLHHQSPVAGVEQQQQAKALLVPGRVLYLNLKPGTDMWAEGGEDAGTKAVEGNGSCCQSQYEPMWLDGNADVLHTMAISHYMLADHIPTKVAKCLAACNATYSSVTVTQTSI